MGLHWLPQLAIATGTAETAPGETSGLPTMGAKTVWNTVKHYDFVDFDKIIAMGPPWVVSTLWVSPLNTKMMYFYKLISA